MARPPPPPAAAIDEPANAETLADLPLLRLVDRALEPSAPRGLRRRYLAALRLHEEPDAQVVAVLVLFQLARRGDAVAQTEFLLLRPTLERSLREGMPPCVEAHDELRDLWRAAAEALRRADPRERAPVFPFDGGSGPTFPLFGDEDEEVDPRERENEVSRDLRRLVSADFGDRLRAKVVRLSRMLDLSTAEDVDRLETFLQHVGDWATVEPSARGLASLGHLYLAVHLRRHGLFSTVNDRRSDALRAGLSALGADLDSLLTATSFLAAEGDRTDGFRKVLELLVDYVAWCHREGADPLDPEAIDSYSEAARLPSMVLGSGGRRRR